MKLSVDNMDLNLTSPFKTLALSERGVLWGLTPNRPPSSQQEILPQNVLMLQSTARELKGNMAQVGISKCFPNDLGPKFHKLANNLVTLHLYVLEEYLNT